MDAAALNLLASAGLMLLLQLWGWLCGNASGCNNALLAAMLLVAWQGAPG